MKTTSPITIWRGGRIATMDANRQGLGVIDHGCVVATGDRIAWVGETRDLPSDLLAQASSVVELEGRLVTPGLIDCHTHLVFGGDRSQEWGMRLAGESYEAIARAGGGIVSSVAATRLATEDQLIASALPRLDSLLADGVTTVEIKSGYGLTLEDELKMLRVARNLGRVRPVRIRTTLLAAHTVPPEHKDSRAAYLAKVIDEIIPAAAKAGLADAVDAFCETIAFTREETRAVFEAARAHGLPIKLHADQLSDSGGAGLAAAFKGLSADHLEHASEAGLAAMAKAGVVGVLLPGAFYVLRESTKPPVEAMRRAGVTLAVASDCNPGTSPVASLRLAMHLACTLFGLTPEEALLGVTRNAAGALGLQDEIGQLTPGRACDLAIWEARAPEALIYWLGRNPAATTVLGGV